MSWEGPDKERDEDRYYEDESMVPPSLLSPLSGVGAAASELALGREPSTATASSSAPENGWKYCGHGQWVIRC
jgi:hypothetical protein